MIYASHLIPNMQFVERNNAADLIFLALNYAHKLAEQNCIDQSMEEKYAAEPIISSSPRRILP